jgi:hypothetical protein
LPTAIAVLAVLGLAAPFATAQQPDAPCGGVQPVRPRPRAPVLLLPAVAGQVVFAMPGQHWESGPVGGFCVVLSDARGGAPVAVTVTDADGQFAARTPHDGDYTLVATAASSDEPEPLAVRVRVVSGGAARHVDGHRLLLRIRLRSDSRHSFATVVSDDALRRELVEMAANDQVLRRQPPPTEPAALAEYQLRLAAGDRPRTARLRAIVRRYGWPKLSLVGYDGAQAAWLVLQHADLATQKAMLRLVRRAFESGDLTGDSYALTLDRVLAFSGRPQIYGSQLKPRAQWADDEPEPYPIADPAGVDRRRAAMGMRPLAEYLAGFRAAPTPAAAKP